MESMFLETPGCAFYCAHATPSHDFKTEHRAFAGYTELSTFVDIYKKLPPNERAFYEIIEADRPVRFYMDIEWYTPMEVHLAENTERADMSAILACVKEAFGGVGVEVKDDDVLLTTASREDRGVWKSSFHVTFRGTYFESVDVMKAFVSHKLQPECSRCELVRFNHKKNKVESMVDFKVYTKNRLMRCALSRHAHKSTTLEMIDWFGQSKYIEDYLITAPPQGPVALVTKELLEQHSIKVERKKTSANCRRASTLKNTTEIAEKLKALLKEQLKDELSNIGVEKESMNGDRSFYCLTNGHRICPEGERHESNNFYLRVDDKGFVKYNCLGCQKTADIGRISFEDGNHITPMEGIEDLVAEGEEEDMDTDEDSHFSSHASTVTPYSSDFVQQYQINKKCLMVKSEMGTGKTTELKNFLEREVKAFPRVLWLSTRIAYTDSVMGILSPLGFQSYLDASKPLPQCDRLVLQYESLHKLNGFKPYDLLVLDEVESILSQVCCRKTNADHMKCNQETFAAIAIFPSTKVLCMDADLGERTLGVFNKLLSKEEIEVDINLKQKMYRTIELVNGDDWMKSLMQDVANGKNVAIASGSKSTIQEVQTALESHEPKIAIKLYDADCDDKDIRDLRSIDAEWARYQLVMFSPKITVGSDFSRAHFDVMYAVGCADSVSPRVLLQMTGRVRHLREEKIVLWLKTPTASKNEFCTLDEIKQHFTEYTKLLNHTRLSLCKGLMVRTFEESWESLAECYNVLEDNRKKCCFLQELEHFCRTKGYTIKDDRHKKKLSPELGAAKVKVMANRICGILCAKGDAQACIDRVRKNQASAADKLVADRARIQNLFQYTLDPVQLALLQDHHHQDTLVNLQRVRTYSVKGALKKFEEEPTSSLFKSNWPQKYNILHTILTLLGLKDMSDTITVIPRAKIDDCSVQLMEHLKHLDVVCGKPPREFTSKKLLKQVMERLNPHLKGFVGFELKSTNRDKKTTAEAYKLVGVDITFPKDTEKREELFRAMYPLLADLDDFRGMTLQAFSKRLTAANTTFAELAPMLKIVRETRNLECMDAYIVRQA